MKEVYKYVTPDLSDARRMFFISYIFQWYVDVSKRSKSYEICLIDLLCISRSNPFWNQPVLRNEDTITVMLKESQGVFEGAQTVAG